MPELTNKKNMSFSRGWFAVRLTQFNITVRPSSVGGLMHFVGTAKRDMVCPKQSKFASSRSHSLSRTCCDVDVANKAQWSRGVNILVCTFHV